MIPTGTDDADGKKKRERVIGQAGVSSAGEKRIYKESRKPGKGRNETGNVVEK